jgi:hypothetical protein
MGSEKDGLSRANIETNVGHLLVGPDAGDGYAGDSAHFGAD